MRKLLIIAGLLLTLTGCTKETTIVEDSRKLYDQIERGKSFTYEFNGEDGNLNFVLSRDKAGNYKFDYNPGDQSLKYYIIDDKFIACEEDCEYEDVTINGDYVSSQFISGAANTEEMLTSEYGKIVEDTEESRTFEIGLTGPGADETEQVLLIERTTIAKDGKQSTIVAECLEPKVCNSYDETLTIEKVEKIKDPIE